MLLTTERLLLREFTANDWHAVFAYQSDPRYLRYSPWTHRPREHVERLVQAFIRWQQEQPRCKFQLELGYELHPDHWGQGYATEAARSLLTFGFQTLHLQRVWAQCIAENIASARVLERLGMRDTRRLPQHTLMQNRWWDMLYTIDRAA